MSKKFFGCVFGKVVAMGRKDKELKDFLIAERKRTGTGTTTAPVWAMQKAGTRIYNKHAKKHWRETSFGAKFRKLKRKERNFKSGDHYKRGRAVKAEKARTNKRPI